MKVIGGTWMWYTHCMLTALHTMECPSTRQTTIISNNYYLLFDAKAHNQTMRYTLNFAQL